MPGLRRFCATAFFSAALVASACGGAIRREPLSEETPVARNASSPPSTSTSSSASTSSASTSAEDTYLSAKPVSAKSIGHTSYVLKVTLEGGLVVAFKPRSVLPLGDRRYKGEIAAYRLARALGLDNVPRAMPRTFVASVLQQAFVTQKGAAEFEQKVLVDKEGRVNGAMMPWIAQYRSIALEEPSWRARWTAWLTNTRTKIAAPDLPLASSISTMLVFDYVTANWDRWSGGNVARDGATDGLLFVDNDGAFYERPPPDALTQQLAILHRVVRFSRKFVAALRSLDDAKLREALGQDTGGEPLLSDRVLGDMQSRRATVLRVIDARIARLGETATFCFD